jgi:hypothetical protein
LGFVIVGHLNNRWRLVSLTISNGLMSPIFLRLALHGRRIRIFDLHPMR